MNVNTFMNLLLLESIISNISNIKLNENLIDIFIINSYSPILSSEFIDFMNKTLSETSFKEEEKNELLALINDGDRKSYIIKNGSDHKKTLNYIREKEREKDRKIEEANKKVEETNIENEKIRKDKEKSDAEKNEVLKENERLINIIKKKETGDKIDKYRNMMRNGREGKIKRRNIKIKKIACVILISALISTLLFILIKNNKNNIDIKTLINKNIKLPDIVTGIIIFIIVNLITFLFKIICDKIKKKKR